MRLLKLVRSTNSKIDGAASVTLLVGTLCAIGAVVLAGCGSDDGKGIGASCSSTAECKSVLLCRDGICREPGMGSDTGTDTGEEFTEEEYLITYSEVDQNSSRTLKVHNTATGESKGILPDAVSDCQSWSCFVSEDYEYFFASPSGESNLQRWEIGEDLTAQGSGQMFAQNVRDVKMVGSHVLFQRGGVQEEQTGFVKPTSGGNATEIGTFDSDGSFLASPDNDRAVIFDTEGSLQELKVKLGTMSELDAEVSLGGANFQESGGSYFDGNVDAAFSDDGSRLTFLTSAPNDYETCTRSNPQDRYSGECEAVAARCGAQRRCSRWEVTAHIVDMEHRGELGESCEFDDQCSGVHECYYPGDNQTDQAECIPRRAVLGVAETVPQNNMQGCELVQQDSTIDFTQARGAITYDDEKRPYLVGTADRSCLQDYDDGERVGQAIRIKVSDSEEENGGSGDSNGKDYTRVAGIPADQPFRPSDCLDDASGEYTLDTCTPFIYEAHLSPGADELVFNGTNPAISTPGFSVDQRHLWRTLRGQSERWFLGNTENTFRTVRQFDIHPLP